MKRVFSVILLFVFLTIISGCSSKNKDSEVIKIPFDLSTYLHDSGMVMNDPVDDPQHYDHLFKKDDVFNLVLSEPFWLIPSGNLPRETEIDRSNNNVNIIIYKGRLYLGFRTGPTHFAGKNTVLYVLSSGDGENWDEELRIALGQDAREPHFFVLNDLLHFYYFSAGKQATAFKPERIQVYTTEGNGIWEGPMEILEEGEVHWSIKKRGGNIYMTSYLGEHYKLRGEASVKLLFRKTYDGINWENVGGRDYVYKGGVSETAFEFDREGNLWAVTRNEDGDSSGFGSHLVFAPAEDISGWQFPDECDPTIYMSPKMFRHGNDIYLIARKQLGAKPFGRAGRDRSWLWQRLVNWISYSLTPKTTALYKIDTHNKKIDWVLDLPGAGDTAFPSIIRLDAHNFLFVNYTTPPEKKRRPWLFGQIGETKVYMQMISFEKR